MPSVYLANGHGLRPNGSFDPGAVAGDESEQTAGDIIVDRAAARLRAAGVVVHDEAFKDDPNFVGSAEAANDLGVDLCVEIHHDWVKAPEGAFGFWYPGSSRGKRAADLILDAIVERGYPTRREWHKGTDEHYILRETRMPCVLFEVGRIGQYSDEELVDIGDAVADGVAGWFGLPLAPLQGATPFWEQVVVYDPETDGRDLGAATVLAQAHNLKLLATTDKDEAGEAYLVGMAASTANTDRYDETIHVAGQTFGGTALEVAEWVEKLERK